MEFPFEVTVDSLSKEARVQGLSGKRVKVQSIGESNESVGLLAIVVYRSDTFTLPITCVDAVHDPTTEHDCIELYCTWYANC